MDIFQVLKLLGGLSLFLFGMNLMGQALERRAGTGLRTLLSRLTTGKLAGLLTGLSITAVIQSSSAATVMVVGFVNSNLMTLKQAINVIMGANIGTTITAWLLSLAGIESGNLFVRLLKPSSFTPVLAFIGIICYMFCKSTRKKDTGVILLGFATLMFGMEEMAAAVAGLGDIPAFQELFLLFRNPLLGLLAGAILTAVIQSSSASVGILQALAVTGQVSYGAAIPIIMGQNIGTCVTAMLSSVGANKNARRAALVHLSFNVIGSGVWLAVFWLVQAVLQPAFLDMPTSLFGIAAAHSAFNLLCTVLMLPLSGLLERLVTRLVPDDAQREAQVELDERLFTTPSIALEQCRGVAADMAHTAVSALKDSLALLDRYSAELAASIREKEEKTDHYEEAEHQADQRGGPRGGRQAVEDDRRPGAHFGPRGQPGGVGGGDAGEETPVYPRRLPGAGRPLPRRLGAAGPDPVRLSGQRPGARGNGRAPHPGGEPAEGTAAHQPHTPPSAGGVYHRRRLCLVGPAHRPGPHIGPLLQHCRVRH